MTNSRVGIIFNGQGAHFQGMGQDFNDQFPTAQAVYETAERVTDWPIRQWIQEHSDELSQTQYAQASIAATSLAIYQTLREQLQTDFEPAVLAGLSLGEYSALLASGSLSLEDGFQLLKQRGELMTTHCQQLAQEQAVGLQACMNVPLEELTQWVHSLQEEGHTLYIANDNSSRQVIVGGVDSAFGALNQVLKDNHYRSLIPLKVEGPFHTPLMAPIQEEFSTVVRQYPWQTPQIPVISNTTLAPHTKETTPQLLTDHLTQRVRWRETIDQLAEEGITHLIQIGPGNTLQRLLRRQKNAPKCLVIDQVADLDEVQAFLERID